MGLACNPVNQKRLLSKSIPGRTAVAPASAVIFQRNLGNDIFTLETSTSCGKLE